MLKFALHALALLLVLGRGSASAEDLQLADWQIRSLSPDNARPENPPSTDPVWHKARVPSTVMGALVADGTYKNIFVGKNLDAIPADQFKSPWQYHIEFNLTDRQAAQNAILHFDGINYRAAISLNGQQITTPDKTFGAFRTFSFDVSRLLHAGKNTLDVNVAPPKAGDFTVGFVDWNPEPPDHNMGLFRPVYLHFFRDVYIDHVFVETKINHETWNTADLTLHATVTNATDSSQNVSLASTFQGFNFSHPLTLKPRETADIAITSAENRSFHIADAQLWWPHDLGKPYLYDMTVAVVANGPIRDEKPLRFGIRETADYLTPEGYRGYSINGKKILIKGGGWVDDLFLNEDPQKLAAQIRYVKDMNLNTIRLEGFWGESQSLYDLADKEGLLIMPGFSCQWEWEDYLGKKVASEEYGGFQTKEEQDLATDYLRDQVLWLRNHPSIFVWVLGSDKMPQTELETRFTRLLKQIDPTRPTLMSCHANTSKISGPVAVKMDGPYDYVTPNYWYEDTKHGGAFGFNTETGPGPQPPPLDSLKAMLPPDKLWPINDFWDYHCGRHEFNTMNRYMKAFNARYGEAKSVEEFAFKSQAANYEALRPMFESFAVNRPKTTGIIQWMLNASWPKMYWQCYDYYLNPGAAYFATKKGAASLNIIYNYADKCVYRSDLSADSGYWDRWVKNGGDMAPRLPSETTILTIYDLHSKIVLQQSADVNPFSDAVEKLSDLAKIQVDTPVYFLDLKLVSKNGTVLASNFYWLSTKPDVLDEEKSTWFTTPNKSFADFSALNQLPKSQVTLKESWTANKAAITLTNPTDHLAFFLELRATDDHNNLILPALWSDNYISLPPHSQRTLTLELPPNTPSHKIQLQGWNLE